MLFTNSSSIFSFENPIKMSPVIRTGMINVSKPQSAMQKYLPSLNKSPFINAGILNSGLVSKQTQMINAINAIVVSATPTGLKLFGNK